MKQELIQKLEIPSNIQILDQDLGKVVTPEEALKNLPDSDFKKIVGGLSQIRSGPELIYSHLSTYTVGTIVRTEVLYFQRTNDSY
jgi:hypothetical protein